MNPFSRTQFLLGSDAMEKLKNARVAVFGLGGVGSYVAEALVRSGVGALDLVDHDTISLTNTNRQILATRDTVGMDKAEVAAQRAKAINPDCDAKAIKTFYLPETAHQFDFTRYDYVVDAIDTVAGKLSIIENAVKAGTPVISAMGAGNKLETTAFEVADISKTSVCPLARVMRRELKKRGIKGVKVVYSKEEPISPSADEQTANGKPFVGSVVFVPAVAGLLMANEVVKDLVAKT